MNRFGPLIQTCLPCRAHFLLLNETHGPLKAAITFYTAAKDANMDPTTAFNGYFQIFHDAGHPVDAGLPEVDPGACLREAYETRIAPHPFESFLGREDFCQHMSGGDMCTEARDAPVHGSESL